MHFISPIRPWGAIILTHLPLFYVRMLSWKIQLYWLHSSLRIRFLNYSTLFLHFCDYLPRPFIWTNLNSLHSRLICTKFDWFWPAGSGKEDFFFNFSVFSLFRYYLSLEKGNPLLLSKLESPPYKNDLCQVWLKLAQWSWRKRLLNNPTLFFTFCDYFWTNLNSLHPRIICIKFDWFWTVGSGEDF
jgi:hypothetical protein